LHLVVRRHACERRLGDDTPRSFTVHRHPIPSPKVNSAQGPVLENPHTAERARGRATPQPSNIAAEQHRGRATSQRSCATAATRAAAYRDSKSPSAAATSAKSSDGARPAAAESKPSQPTLHRSVSLRPRPPARSAPRARPCAARGRCTAALTGRRNRTGAVRAGAAGGRAGPGTRLW
jgi:hypothetical protein